MLSAVVFASLVTFSAQMSRPLSVCPSEIFFTIGSAASRSYCSSYCSLPSPATASERVHTSYPLSSPSGTAAAEALAFRAPPTTFAARPSRRSDRACPAVA